MANGDSNSGGGLGGVLSGLGKGLSEVLPYALPAAMGAMMGGPMGAAAGFMSAKGEEAKYEVEEGHRGFEWLKLGLEQQQIQSNEDLKKAQLQATEEDRQERRESSKLVHTDLEKWRGQTSQERAKEFGVRIAQHANEFDSMMDLRKSNQLLVAQGQQLQAAIAGTAEQDRRDKLKQQLNENIAHRVQGAQGAALNASQFATKNRAFWDKYVKEPNLSDEEYQQRVYDIKFADLVKGQPGLGAETLLNNGVDPDVVKKIYPPISPSAKLTAGRGAGAAPTTDVKLPGNIKTTGQALKWLQMNKKMSRGDAVEWIKANAAD